LMLLFCAQLVHCADKTAVMPYELDAFENCFMTFPSHSTAGDDYQVILNDDSTELKYDKDVPVIILLGWAGCQQRHLKKYRAIYEKK